MTSETTLRRRAAAALAQADERVRREREAAAEAQWRLGRLRDEAIAAQTVALVRRILGVDAVPDVEAFEPLYPDRAGAARVDDGGEVFWFRAVSGGLLDLYLPCAECGKPVPAHGPVIEGWADLGRALGSEAQRGAPVRCVDCPARRDLPEGQP